MRMEEKGSGLHGPALTVGLESNMEFAPQDVLKDTQLVQFVNAENA